MDMQAGIHAHPPPLGVPINFTALLVQRSPRFPEKRSRFFQQNRRPAPGNQILRQQLGGAGRGRGERAHLDPLHEARRDAGAKPQTAGERGMFFGTMVYRIVIQIGSTILMEVKIYGARTLGLECWLFPLHHAARIVPSRGHVQ